ncbi:hypothetical protein GCM10007973_12550 [Polymorphobacter multimanifer]|uniref:RND family efflux transporter MFP subunit n=1 Tax=Polymorphobacter multimanifer TaxID=1070431 RepID=A0A841L8S5_9SPHN|nr:efflux RND transporter periplasmic adaptor subunit [Polymorphobacter multimanifer]MBB6229037.1 RND family efflux transporter MFP subunit [Polymorphobacter multimanifer]GGI77146.1 hypothetical protein GCM10007973_12550 [Polymorphobacter multimanifer]
MADVADKLRRLRIDSAAMRRPAAAPEPVPATRRRVPGAAVAAAMMVLAAAGAGFAAGRAGERSQVAAAPPVVVAPTPTAPVASVVAAGHVVARRQATIAAPVTGRIDHVEVEEGQRIAAGTVIARIDDAAAAAQVDDAAASLRAAHAEIDRLAARRREAAATQLRFDTLDARGFARGADVARAAADVAAIDAELVRARALVDVGAAGLAGARVTLSRMVIRAPFSGVVTRLSAQPGEIISPVSGGGGFTRTGICTIVDMDSLEVEVDVSEAQIAAIRPGQGAAISLDAYPDRPYAGRVLAVVPIADRARATFRVRVGFDRIDARLMPEMAARIAFQDGART